MEWLVGVLVFVILILLILLFSKQTREQVLRPAQDKLVGLCNFALEQSVRKGQNKQKILELFQNSKELTNEQIREELSVSYRSVIRYMDELEKEGRVRQVGNTGRGVSYILSAS